MSINIKKVLVFVMVFISVFTFSTVKADSFSSLDERVKQNNSFVNNSNKMDYVTKISYTDKRLKDIGGMELTKDQQSYIQNFVDYAVLGGTPKSYSYLDRMKKINEWIVNNFYFSETSLNSNPYYLISEEYNKTGKIRANNDGYVMTFIAFARTQGVSSRMVEGYFNDSEEWESISQNDINRKWVQLYIEKGWVMIDPLSDSFKTYDEETDNYIDQTPENYEFQYLGLDLDEFSKTHVVFKGSSGLKNFKYIADWGERRRITAFLNQNSNGLKINPEYNTSEPNTWFLPNDGASKVNGNGNVTKIYWPNNRNLIGTIDLNYLTKLENLSLAKNKVTRVSLLHVPNLVSANLQDNNLTYAVQSGSKKLRYFNTLGNPTTYIEYHFNNARSRTVLKVNGPGTISAKYELKGRNHNHILRAIPNKGYIFDGWYQNGKRVSKNVYINMNKSSGFIYIAKFVTNKGTVVEVSISKQKLWYYKNGELKMTSNVVTGTANRHGTPTGTFKIRSKSRRVYLVGPDYRSYVNYWMPIYGDIGLHDATWRSKFGGSIYKYNGSHGCINLPLNTAKYIYNNVPKGTKVRVYK